MLKLRRVNKKNILVLCTTTVAVIAILAVIGVFIPSAASLYTEIWRGFVSIGAFIWALGLALVYVLQAFFVGYFVNQVLLKVNKKMERKDRLADGVISYTMIAVGFVWAFISQILLILMSKIFPGFYTAISLVADPMMLIEAPFVLWGFLVWNFVAYCVGWSFSYVNREE